MILTCNVCLTLSIDVKIFRTSIYRFCNVIKSILWIVVIKIYFTNLVFTSEVKLYSMNQRTLVRDAIKLGIRPLYLTWLSDFGFLSDFGALRIYHWTVKIPTCIKKNIHIIINPKTSYGASDKPILLLLLLLFPVMPIKRHKIMRDFNFKVPQISGISLFKILNKNRTLVLLI